MPAPLKIIPMTPHSPIRSAIGLTIDWEDYFQVEAMAGVVGPEAWPAMPSRIEATSEKLLQVLASTQARATFFMVGWLAQRFPQLVARIAAAGHEIGCHSYWHRPVFRLSKTQFREDTLRAKDAIELAAGVAVDGYRAPNFSIREDMRWAWEVLAEAGFRYDSSVHPIHHPFYGAPGASRLPHRIAGTGLWEFPLATAAAGSHNLPIAGGGFWRLAPLAYIRWGLRRALAQGLRPVCYAHPWEFDPAQPRQPLGWRQALRHYTGLRTTEPKLRALLRDFRGVPLRALYAAELAPRAHGVAA